MFYRFLPRVFYLIAIYAAVCLFWVEFADWVASNIGTYDELKPSRLDLAAAALLAAVLYILIVIFIFWMDRKHQVRFADTAQPYLHPNVTLVVFSAAFLTVAVLSGIQGDYKFHLHEWTAVLGGHDPWERGTWDNNYGPLFNALAPLAWVNPLANKLLFAFAYLVFIVWLIKDFAPRRGFVTLSWPFVGLWLLNPFPWEQIAYCGYFDVLVSLACVAAVHYLVRNKDVAAGTCLALGVLLKYMPIVILPFLVFSDRRFHFRLLISCVAVVILGLIFSVFTWGTSTFLPLTVAATRNSVWSIYIALPSTHSPLQPFLHTQNVDWLDKPLLLAAGLGTFMWCIVHRVEPALSSTLGILVTLLFYRVGYANYQMVLFSLVLYWVVSTGAQFKNHSFLAMLLIGYFGFLSISNLAFWSGLVGSIFYSNIVVVLLQFLLGCALLVSLIQLKFKPGGLQDATKG